MSERVTNWVVRIAIFTVALCALSYWMFVGCARGATLDDFNRPDGPLTGKWNPAGPFVVEAGQLRAVTYASTVYDSILPTNQIVSARWSTVGGNELDVLLKVQGLTASAAHIEVRYDSYARLLSVNTWAGSWVGRGSWARTLVSGDTLTASCDSVGLVTVWHNSAKVGTASCAGWAYAGAAGRVGVTMAIQPRLDVIAAGSIGGTGIVQPPPIPIPAGPYLGPLNDPIKNISLKWTFPTLDAAGLPETSLRNARIEYRVNETGAAWSSNVIGTGAHNMQGKQTQVAMPWYWFPPGKAMRFRVVLYDTTGNQSAPSNEVVRVP